MELLSRILFVLFTASFFVICDTLSAYWGRNGGVWYLVSIIALAPLGYLMFALLNRTNSLSVSSGLVNTMIIIGTIMIGILGFQDALTVKQGVGLFFAVLAVGLMI